MISGTDSPDRLFEALQANPGLVVLLVVVLALEIVLLAWAFLDWVKRPAELIRGNRILWLLVILFVNMIGPIAYMAAARKPAEVTEAPSAAADAQRASDAVDVLYGDPVDPR
jgi:hypothetical protein